MSDATSDLGPHVLEVLIGQMRSIKRQGERAYGQLGDDDFFVRLGGDSNSAWVIIKHMAGNMRSRWTDFLTTDGEKLDRARDTEFVEDHVSREQIEQTWQGGWGRLFETLESLTPADLTRNVVMRGKSMTAMSAIVGQLSHYAYHVGQIVTLAKHILGDRWVEGSIPRGRSEQYNREHWGNDPAGCHQDTSGRMMK